MGDTKPRATSCSRRAPSTNAGCASSTAIRASAVRDNAKEHSLEETVTTVPREVTLAMARYLKPQLNQRV
jgi:hypothetical protein